MAAAEGNKNAVGNSGGKSLNDRKQAAEVRRLALFEMQRVLEGEDNEFKKQLLLRLANSVLPRLNEHTGGDGEAINVNIVNYGNNITSPIHSAPIPDSTSTSVAAGS